MNAKRRNIRNNLKAIVEITSRALQIQKMHELYQSSTVCSINDVMLFAEISSYSPSTSFWPLYADYAGKGI